MKFKSTLTILITSTLLGGCALYHNPQKTKIGGVDQPVTMDKVNDYSTSGRISPNKPPYLGDRDLGGYDTYGYKDPNLEKSENQKIPDDVYEQFQRRTKGYSVATPNIGQPVRNGDRVQKIYIFPFEDEKGNYYETSIMYTVVQKSHWVDYPTQQVIEDYYDLGYTDLDEE